MLGLEDSIIFAASLDVGILTLNPIKENTQNIQLFCHDMKQSRPQYQLSLQVMPAFCHFECRPCQAT